MLPIIEVKKITKQYRIKDSISNKKTSFNSLEEVSFTVNRGECIGLLGNNGAGKSTLLKIIANIVTPSSGEVLVRGSVAAMLDFSASLHDDLTGKENVFVYGSLLGMKRKEIKRHYEEIISYAEIEGFMSTKVKSYSSGMKLRLAFSIASVLEPDILLADEILAVGDATFQEKCLYRMLELKKQGTTIFLVQHELDKLKKVCDRYLLLDKGKITEIESIDL